VDYCWVLLLPVNFAQPYLSGNLKEFWRRWHMSLSSFIRDYVYVPLGGNRRGFILTQCNIFVAMVISGIWHGAGIGFILWGVIHGLGLVIANVFTRYLPNRISPLIGRGLTFIFVSFAWVFFRSNSLEHALNLLARIISPLGEWKITSLYLWGFLLFLVLSRIFNGLKTFYSQA
jgi:D-alanyl-lipoteichoic acid acyltransferase DltB (MBOAT superfamily)